jgi:hypothetical protein
MVHLQVDPPRRTQTQGTQSCRSVRLRRPRVRRDVFGLHGPSARYVDRRWASAPVRLLLCASARAEVIRCRTGRRRPAAAWARARDVEQCGSLWFVPTEVVPPSGTVTFLGHPLEVWRHPQ